MRHGIVHITFVFLFLGVLAGCNAQKRMSRNAEEQARTERTETKTADSRVKEESQTDISTQTNEQDRTYVRITEYDSTGYVRRIQEEWRDIGRSQLSVLDQSRHHISIDGMTSVTAERDNSRSVVTENGKTSADSRLVQGVEWLWVILAGFLILSVAIFVIIKKTRKKWPL